MQKRKIQKQKIQTRKMQKQKTQEQNMQQQKCKNKNTKTNNAKKRKRENNCVLCVFQCSGFLVNVFHSCFSYTFLPFVFPLL